MSDGTRGHPRPRTVTWLDPGATTGWARYTTAGSSFQSGQLEFIPMCVQLDRWLRDDGSAGWLSWESFQIRPGSGRMKQDGSSLMMIGVASWLAFLRGSRVVKPQAPDARSLGLKNLRQVGWHSPGKVHANDAAAHLLALFLRVHITV